MWGFVERRAKFKVHSKTPVSQYSNNVLLPHIHGILVVNKDISEQFNIGECLDDPWNNLSLASIPNLKSIDIQLITETPEKAIDYAVQIDWNGDNWDVIGFGNSDAAYVHKKTAA
ncbi:MAG: hypothetical protein C0606_13085 [Hyphomicrobiales bacterium]|nr:MAG: hypothetical protein C0606_13085 [Hyphomicrobiales bacterium]